MKKSVKIVLIIVGALAALAVSLFLAIRFPLIPPPSAITPTRTFIANASYFCNNNKTIQATYYDGPSKPPAGPDMPPTPGGSVDIVLSDRRAFTLPQTISASGIRYANSDESFIFWSKGDGAFVVEHETETYSGCLQHE